MRTARRWLIAPAIALVPFASVPAPGGARETGPHISTARQATEPAVPRAAQRRLLRTHPRLAAVPTRLPLRTRFAGWRFDAVHATVIERFQDERYPGNQERTLTITIARHDDACASGSARTLQMAGNRVYVDMTGSTVWRCLAGAPTLKVSATSGGYLPDVGLGRVVASVRRLP